MEQTMNVSALNKVAKVELIYKTKVKASERPAIKTSKNAMICFCKAGMKQN